jgi:hypothetical protein
MMTDGSKVAWRHPARIWAAAVLCLALSSGEAGAAYDYSVSQISPVPLTMAQIAAIFNQIATSNPYLDAYHQTTTDAAGVTLGLTPAKVVQSDDEVHPYLAVFHHPATPVKFATYAAYSTDLVNWHTLGAIDDVAAGEYGSQPDIRILSDDSILFGEEYNPASRPQVRVRYYGITGGQTGLAAFIANPGMTPTYQVVLPNFNAFSAADGTPEFARIDYTGSISSSEIEITHHYFNSGVRDLDAIGTLTDFNTWSDTNDSLVNGLVSNAGGNGNIGDRELFVAGSIVYEVVEAQVNPTSINDFGSWRLFLVNRTQGMIRRLSPRLVGGAKSLGNPTASFVTLPDGAPALIFTCVVFGQNHGTTPSGGHMYVFPLANQP